MHINNSGTIVKQFIRNVRAAKTIADERAVIQKESAAIRASFREESADHGIRYATKLDILLLQHISNTDGSIQTKQCCEAALSLHTRRADTLWPDRMHQTVGITPLCR